MLQTSSQMFNKPWLICLLFLSSYSHLTGQRETDRTQDITFDPFKGIVYSMPLEEHDNDPAFVRSAEETGGRKREERWVSKKIADRYSDRVRNYPQIGEITLERIHIPETIIGYGVFPGVRQTSRFCMILNSTMYIEREGCYEFSLNSDDGSVLWIDDIEVVNNDGGHQMRLVRDSVALKTGVYGARMWYFQGLPDRFGLVFDARWVGDMSACDALESRQPDTLSSILLFDTGEYTLTAIAKTALIKLLDTLSQQAIRSIEIAGHTDAMGSPESNRILSQKRADAVAEQIRLYFHNATIEIKTIGNGESRPIATNDTEAGRQENRRVEINIVLKKGK